MEARLRAAGSRPTAAAAPGTARGGRAEPSAARAAPSLDASDPGFWQAAEKRISEGEALVANGDWARGRERIEEIVPAVAARAKDSPFYKRALTAVGVAYLHLGNPRQGARMLGLALQQDPGYAPARQALDAALAGRPPPPFTAPGGAAGERR